MPEKKQAIRAADLTTTPSMRAVTAAPPVVPLWGGREARLPFTVRVVDDDETLARALRMRQAAYQRHVLEFARTLDQPEPYDRDPGGMVLLAEQSLTAVRSARCVSRATVIGPWHSSSRWNCLAGCRAAWSAQAARGRGWRARPNGQTGAVQGVLSVLRARADRPDGDSCQNSA